MPPGLQASDFYYLWPELVVATGAIAVLVLELVRNQVSPPSEGRRAIADRAELVLTLATLGAAAALLTTGAGANLTIVKGVLAIDGFALFFKSLFLGAAALTTLMSARYLRFEGVRPGEYYALVLCATLGMMISAGAIDLITIFIGLETMTVSFYVLSGIIRSSRRSNEAAMKYFVLGTFSLAILLYGLSLLYGLTGSTHLRTIATALAADGGGPLLMLAVVLVIAGLGFKIAAVPFHMWAPDVYEGAPTPVTAFLSVGSKAAAFALVLRIFVEGLPAFRADGLAVIMGAPVGWRAFFYVLALLTMTVGNLAALTQGNTKRLLAYSSIAHAGYVLIGVVAGPSRGVAAALVYLLVYALMQLGAFAVVVLLRRREVIGDELKDLTGLYATHPAAAMAMLLFLLSLGGVPPTAGFMGKLWLFGAAIDAGYVGLAVVGVLNSALSLYYYIRIVVFMWTPDQEPAAAFRIGWPVTAVLVVSVLGTLLLGLYPRPLFDFATSSAASLGATPLVGSK
jgi:NADH-quinone oxidoreductase subunit N